VICGRPLRPRETAMCGRCLASSEKKQREQRIRPIAAARTPFGTRIAQAITCVECGKKDHIGFRPKKGARTLCRECAAALLGRVEAGQQKPRELRTIVCAHCKREAQVPANLPDDIALLCRDCFNGIYSYQGDRTRDAERRKSGTLLSRRRKSAAQAPDVDEA
jgi:CxxC-x17-CxxC domain-containing protein